MVKVAAVPQEAPPRDGLDPLLVFLHPIGLCAAFWDGVIARLAPHATCLAFDLAGHGARPALTGPLSFQLLAEDVWSQWDDAAGDAAGDGARRCVLIGCSMGGMVAQAMAIARPGRVAGLVLSNTSATLPDPARVALLARAQEALADAGRLNQQTVARWFSPGHAGCREAEVALVSRWLAATPVQVQAQCWQLIAALNHAQALACLEMPILVLTGSEDASSPPAAAEAWARQLRHAQACVLPGAGHLAPFEQPTLFADHVLGFVRKSVT